MSKDARICVGVIAGAFGVNGDVRLKSFCATPEDIADYTPLYAEDGHRYDLALRRAIKNGFAARIEGITTKEQADQLKGTKLYAERDKMPDLPEDEFYHADLMDLEILDTGGHYLGRVRAVHNHGAADLLEIGTDHGTVLLPFTRENVPTVDLNIGRLIVDPPDGLFE